MQAAKTSRDSSLKKNNYLNLEQGQLQQDDTISVSSMSQVSARYSRRSNATKKQQSASKRQSVWQNQRKSNVSQNSSASSFNPKRYITTELKESDIVNLKQLFDYWDGDKNGVLTPVQLKNIFYQHGFKADRDTYWGIIAQLDDKETGGIDFEGFLKMIKEKPKYKESKDDIMKVFKEYDKKNKGFIDLNDLKDVLKQIQDELSDEDLQNIITKCDIDGDGKINFEDFYSVMQADIY